MVGRREKPTLNHGVREELQNDTGSKFRRKLSNGLAFITLTQRKTAPARQLSSNASVAVSVNSTNDSSSAILNRDGLLSSQIDSGLGAMSRETCAPVQSTVQSSEGMQTPKQLPRSRTCSYIPRLVKIDGEVQPISQIHELDETSQSIDVDDSRPFSPTRIPTPSSSQSKRRLSSPRQHRHFNTLPHKLRSHTTSNLTKSAIKPQASNYMAPRRPGAKRLSASSTRQKQVLPENIPTSKWATQKCYQAQGRPIKRESLAVPSAAANRRSCGPSAPLAQNKRASLVPSTGTKHTSNQISQASLTVKATSTKVQGPDSLQRSGETPFRQTTLARIERSPTPTLSTANLVDGSLAPPRFDVNNQTQRRTLGTPNGLGGIWKSSKIFAAANHQVRKLPRSSTFHYFGRRQEASRMPLDPYQDKPPSSFRIAHSVPQQYPSNSVTSFRHWLPMTLRGSECSSKSLLSEIASAQMSAEAASLQSNLTMASAPAPEVAEDSKKEEQHNKHDILRSSQTSPTPMDETRDDTDQARESSVPAAKSTTAQLSPEETDLKSRSISTTHAVDAIEEIQNQRHWSISERFYPSNANKATEIQVKDYMPPLYWAGRFQSRFDRWRTEAMVALLHPGVKVEEPGHLGQCHLDDERKATILIFMQLRDLCASPQAADSLHVCILPNTSRS